MGSPGRVGCRELHVGINPKEVPCIRSAVILWRWSECEASASLSISDERVEGSSDIDVKRREVLLHRGGTRRPTIRTRCSADRSELRQGSRPLEPTAPSQGGMDGAKCR